MSREKDQQQDARHETILHARATGIWLQYPGQGRRSKVDRNPVPTYRTKHDCAAKRMRDAMTAKREIENDTTNKHNI